MPRFIVLLFISSVLSGSALASQPRFALDPKIHETGDVKFGAAKNYLQQVLPKDPALDLHRRLEAFLRIERPELKLKSRGEAHITVVTPPEFQGKLSTKLRIKEVDEIAKNAGIQQAEFKVVCLGRGEAWVDGKPEQTYYLVVESEKLLEIRKLVYEAFKAKGGDASLFDPKKDYYPHVTIGFTAEDLHRESHGVIKDKSSCWADIHEEEPDESSASFFLGLTRVFATPAGE